MVSVRVSNQNEGDSWRFDKAGMSPERAPDSGLLGLYLAFSGGIWFTLVHSGFIWFTCDILWLLCLTPIYSGLHWLPLDCSGLAGSGSLWFTLAYLVLF